MKRKERIMSCFLVVVMAISLASSFMPLQTKAVLNDGASRVIDKEVKKNNTYCIDESIVVKGEVKELRDAFSKHFQLENGEYIAIGHSGDLHRKKGKEWVEIDNRLEIGEDGRLSTKDGIVYFSSSLGKMDNRNQLLFGYKYNDKYEIQFGLGEKTSVKGVVPRVENCRKYEEIQYPLTVKELISQIEEKATKTTVTYDEVFEGVSFKYILDGNCIKEHIILNAPSDRTEYCFELYVKGLNANLVKEGAIILNDIETNEEVIVIPPPTVYDAKGNNDAAIRYKLESISDNKYRVVVSIEEKWLKSKERLYPITIDPTVTSLSSSDSYVNALYPSVNYSYDSSAKTYDSCTAFIKVSPATVPADATVNRASLYTHYRVLGTQGQCLLKVYECTLNWGEYMLTYSTAGTYINTQMQSKYITTSSVYSTSGIVSYDVSKLAKRWYAGEPNNGVAIKQYSGPGKVELYTREMGEGYRPFLVTWYTMDDIPIKTGTYVISNVYSHNNIQPSTAISPNYNTANASIQTASVVNDDCQKWEIVYLHNGYYKITNKKGRMSLSILNDGVYLSDGIVQQVYQARESQQWKIEKDDHSFYKIQAKSQEANGWCLGKTISGNNVIQLKYANDSLHNDEWVIFEQNFFSRIDSYYDKGYYVYYSEGESACRKNIDRYVRDVSNRFFELLGLVVTRNYPLYYRSPIDVCKGSVSSTNINDLCSHSGEKHTERSNVISSFLSAFGGSGLFTNVLWTGHRISSTATNGTTNYNRSCSFGKYIFMLERSDPSKPTIREINSKGVLMHELSHQYGARDHYHELADLSDPSSCKFKEICSECGTNPRPENCIMCNPRIDITNPGTICSACIEDILVYLRSQSGR